MKALKNFSIKYLPRFIALSCEGFYFFLIFLITFIIILKVISWTMGYKDDLIMDLIGVPLIIISLVIPILWITISVLTRNLYFEQDVIVTHRGTKQNIQEKVKKGYLPAHYPNPDKWYIRLFEHSKPCVWISIGKPTICNLLFSGMIGKAEASITFSVNKNLIKNPDGFKYLFSSVLLCRSQKVIEKDIVIPYNAVVKFKK